MSESLSHRPHRLSADINREVTSMVIQDFRKGFFHSQGKRNLHVLINSLLGDEYQNLPPHQMEVLPTALNTLESHLGKLAVPSHHIFVTQMETKEEFTLRFGQFRNSLINPDYLPTREFPDGSLGTPFPTEHSARLDLMIDQMVRVDIRHASPLGAPRVSRANDPRASFLKTYILDRQTTHSARFDAVFSKARQRLAETYPNPLVDSLGDLWALQRNNPQFYPPEFLTDVEATH